jgi:DNA-binding NarL/FixJ family response regulator
MASFQVDVEILIKPTGFFRGRKLALIEFLALGWSNKAIAEEIKISIKSVERIFSELNEKFGNKATQVDSDARKLFNPRLRLLTSLVAENICDINSPANLRLIEELSPQLRQTLILSCIGFSNKAIAELYGIGEKAIELRFSQLFDYFGVDTKSLAVENPRVSLFLSAYCRGNISKMQIKRLYRETQGEWLNGIMLDPHKFIAGLETSYKIIG